MNDYLQSAFSGWAALLALAAGQAMPYLLRTSSGSTKPYQQRMWPHYWLGYLALLASFTHGWLSMRNVNMRGVNGAGVWIATFAVGLLLWQVAVGLMLQNPRQSDRRLLRRTHFWTMASVAGLVVAHVVLNRP
jgi:hypothetical protein